MWLLRPTPLGLRSISIASVHSANRESRESAIRHDAMQVIEVQMVASPRAPPAALERRLSAQRQRKSPEEINDDMRAATEKREAMLQVAN